MTCELNNEHVGERLNDLLDAFGEAGICPGCAGQLLGYFAVTMMLQSGVPPLRAASALGQGISDAFTAHGPESTDERPPPVH